MKSIDSMSLSSKHLEIIGIDSRGVNDTSSHLSSCPSPSSRDLLMLQSSAQRDIESSEVSVSSVLPRADTPERGLSARIKESEAGKTRSPFT